MMDKKLFDEQMVRTVGARTDAPAMPNPFEGMALSPDPEPIAAPAPVAEVTTAPEESVEKVIAASEEPVTHVEEAPVAPEPEPVVEVTTPATPSVAPTMRSREDIVPHRVGRSRTDLPEGMVLRGMYNQGLKTLADNIRETSTVPETITFTGDAINRGKETLPALWEEGGASMRTGSVLIITDPQGNKKEASLVWHGDKYVNGRHALVGISEGDIILCGVDKLRTKDGRECDDLIVAYRVVTISECAPVANERCHYDVNCIIIGNSTTENDTFQWDADGENPVFSTEHPAVQAALARLHEVYAVEPAYIKDYSYHRLVGDDIRNSFTDKEFVASMQKFDTLEAMYQSVEEKVKPYVRTCGKSERVLVNTILDINYPDPVDGSDCLWVFVTGVVYDNTAKTSANNGRIFYGRAKVAKNGVFYYIDATDTKMDAGKVINEMKRRHDGTKYLFQAISSRRMTV